MNVWTWCLKISISLCKIAISLVCFPVRKAESCKLQKPIREDLKSKPSFSRPPGCKEIAFKLETFLSELKGDVNCTKICETKFRILKYRIGKGFDGRTIRPALGKPRGLREPGLAFLDDCMYRAYYCLTQLSDDQLSNPELIAEQVFWDKKLAAAISLSKGLTVCHCGLTLKLWRVSRKDVTVHGAPEKINFSNVEICKRLSLKLSNWPCIAETTIHNAVACTYTTKTEEYKNTKFCLACNAGAHAMDNCLAVNWSDITQGARADVVSTLPAHVNKPGRMNVPTTTGLPTSTGIWELRRLFGRLDDYHMLQLQINQAASASPPAVSINQHRSTDFASSSRPFPNLLPSSSSIPDEYTPVPMESADIFSNVEPTSIAHQAAGLISVEENGKRARSNPDLQAELENYLDLGELLPQRGRWERGQSSHSAAVHLPVFGRTTQSRGETRNTHDSQYLCQDMSLNLLSSGFINTQSFPQQRLGYSNAHGQIIQLEDSWSDILHQLGPEPQLQALPNLASLGTSQLNAALESEINPQQPNLDDFINGGDAPLSDDYEQESFYDEFP